MHTRTLIARIAFTLLLVSGIAAAAPAETEMAPADAELKSLYWSGHEALKHADWNAALARFQELETRLRQVEPGAVDAALYWQAHALQRARRSAEARAVVERLRREFPQSRWNDEAAALLRPAAPADSALDDAGELAEVAVESLLSAPPERAAPLLRKVLEGDQPPRIKKRALFVLSQIDDPSALDSVIALARRPDDPLAHEAIRMLGISGEPRAMSALAELYAQADPGARRRVLDAWLVADRSDLVLDAARTETDEDVRRDAIRKLGAMDARSELQAMLQASNDPRDRRTVIEALGVSGDTDTLARIAGSDPDEAIRIRAMHALGVAGAREPLVALYAQAGNEALRDAVLQGLMISGHSDGLLQLYRSARSNDEKKAILRVLSLVDDDAALQAIESALQR